MKMRALAYFRENPEGNVSSLPEILGYSKRSAERIVAELEGGGRAGKAGKRQIGLMGRRG